MKKNNKGKSKSILRNKGKMAGRFLLVCLLAGMLCGCGARDATMESYATTEQMDSAANVYAGGVSEGYDAGVVEESALEADAGNAQDNRKLIKRVNMKVETEVYDQLMVNLQNKVNELGGYVENTETSGTVEADFRSGSIVARIPADKVDLFVSDVSEISNITYKKESTEDVTLTYVDLDSHKRMLLAEETRLLELMEQAETMDDTISIQSRLTEVRYQIESMESQLRTYDNQIQYSTVTISISEVEKLTVVGEQSAGERIVTGFAESVGNVIGGLKEFGIGVLINLPYILLFIIIIVILIVIIRCIVLGADNHMKKEKAKLAARTQNVYMQNPAPQIMPQSVQMQQPPVQPQNQQPQMQQPPVQPQNQQPDQWQK